MPTWPFVHPWIAASALILGGVPIVIHLLNRRRFRRVIWAAMTFLTAAHRRNARRVKIEQLILLAVRTLIMILIALAVARPLLRPIAAAGLAAASHHRVIVLDDSYSMRMTGPDGPSAFDRATAEARKLLRTFDRGDGVSLVLAARPAHPLIDRPSYDHQDALKAIDARKPSCATTDMIGAFESATRILSDSELPKDNRIVYVLTDGTAEAWSDRSEGSSQRLRDAARSLADQARLIVIDVGPERRDNLAATSLKLAAPLISAEWPATLLAEVTNHGTRQAADLKLQVTLDGQVIRAEPVESIPPKETRRLRFRVQLPGAGSHLIEARILATTPDVLAIDDGRWLAVSVRKQTPVLLVDGRPGADRFAGAAGYLATALAPASGPTDPILVSPRTIMPGELPAEPLSDYAMIALCNVRQLDRDLWERLAAYVRAGGGLIVTMGDQIDADNYNRFGFDDGRGILPARIAGLVGNEDDRDRFARIQTEGLSHPAVVDFAGQPRSSLFLARFYRHAKLQVPPELPGASVILRYDGGDCALAVRTIDQGRVAMASFTANMDWTNLPAKPDYVSLMMNLLTWTVGDPSARRNVLVGEPLIETLSGKLAIQPETVIAPDGRRGQPVATSQPASEKLGDASREENAIVRYEQTDLAGGYKLTVGPRELDFAVNLDPVEGDLSAIAPQTLRERLGCEFDLVRAADEAVALASADTRREIGWTLLWCVLALLVLETYLAMSFGHHRE
ncbi:MAG: VWA domain-containing protein [Phycisphaerae bacterium]|nr:VWA domain-containing protein [Phycisphaerae bacterium]